MISRFSKYLDVINRVDSVKYLGNVVKVVGLTVESIGPKIEIGQIAQIRKSDNTTSLAEVVGFNNKHVILMPFGSMTGIYPGCEVISTGSSLSVSVSDRLKGRVLNGIGKAIDGKEEIYSPIKYSIYNDSPDPIRRKRINKALATGVKAIDSIATVGQGQRIGIFSGAGVGKSTLLGMIARNVESDVNVIAMIGERGREVKDFIEKDLGDDGLRKSILVVATSDAPPLMRVKGAFVAMAIAEYFRDQGQNVALFMDSITRFARAQREIGLAIGEPPATRGFTPSVFTLVPELLERAGTSSKGSITGFFNVLVEADDMNEPISDLVRGHLDGHISLIRSLANKGHYPAVDITDSISRVMIDIVSQKMMDYSTRMKKIVSVYREAEDLINIGAYVKGSNPEIDYSISMIERINNFLRQPIYEKASLESIGKEIFSFFNDDSFDIQEDFKGFEDYLPEEFEGEKFENVLLKQIKNEKHKELFINHYMKQKDSGNYFLRENVSEENKNRMKKILRNIEL